MFKYISKRLVSSVIMMFILITITFFMVKIMPGNPFASDKMQAGSKQALYAYYGLDKPIWQQYIVYISNLLKGDLGVSFRLRSIRVNDIIAQSFPKSCDLGIRATIFALITGLLLGILSALRRGKPIDNISMLIAIIGTSVPSFIIGFFIQYFFSVDLKWFPVSGYDGFRYTILPSFALSLGMLATIAKYTRTSMLEITNSDFVKTANAKGLSKFQIIVKHELRNALIPILTLLGPMIASVITGTFVVEKVFAIPGLGGYFVTSVTNLDYSMVLGLTIFFAGFLVLMNLIVDIAYVLVDPRIRLN
jgi:oligopeptide transport system permease protein